MQNLNYETPKDILVKMKRCKANISQFADKDRNKIFNFFLRVRQPYGLCNDGLKRASSQITMWFNVFLMLPDDFVFFILANYV